MVVTTTLSLKEAQILLATRKLQNPPKHIINKTINLEMMPQLS
jgi:hypothetical protein